MPKAVQTCTTTTPPEHPDAASSAQLNEGDRPAVPGRSPEMTRAVMAASLIPGSQPSVATLGAHLADVERALYCYNDDNFPEFGQEVCAANWARQILEDRAEGLRMVIGTMTATSVPEAAIQTALIVHFAERISSLNGAQSEAAGSLIERLALSVLPVLASHAGMNVDDMGWSELVRIRRGRFEGVGEPA